MGNMNEITTEYVPLKYDVVQVVELLGKRFVLYKTADGCAICPFDGDAEPIRQWEMKNKQCQDQ